MNRIKKEVVFVSQKETKQERIQELYEWRDGMVEREDMYGHSTQKCAFIFNEKEGKVTMLLFGNQQDMQDELGDIIEDFVSVGMLPEYICTN